MPSETCYACNETAISRDHVPPKGFFPAMLSDGSKREKQLITVPSCHVHNGGKSVDDDYLRLALISSAVDPSRDRELINRAVRGVMRHGPLLRHVIQELDPITDAGGLITGFRNRGVTMDPVRIARGLAAVARGLFYHEFGRRLAAEPTVLCPSLIRQEAHWPDGRVEPVELEDLDEAFDGLLWKGDVPAVFRYRGFCSGSSSPWFAALDIMFYQTHRVVAISGRQ